MFLNLFCFRGDFDTGDIFKQFKEQRQQLGNWVIQQQPQLGKWVIQEQQQLGNWVIQQQQQLGNQSITTFRTT